MIKYFVKFKKHMKRSYITFEYIKGCNDPNQLRIYFSLYQLNDVEKLFLDKGLNLALPPKTLNRADYLLPFEMVYGDIKTMDITSSDIDIIKVALKEYAYSFWKELNLSKNEYNALKNLSSLKNIIIQKSDK